MSINNVNPSAYFGGTWEQIKDVFLLSAGNTYKAGTTGGKTLHNHVLNNKSYANIAFSSGSLYQIRKSGIRYTANQKQDGSIGHTAGTYSMNDVTTLGGMTENESNMPPYLAVYMWRRTA